MTGCLTLPFRLAAGLLLVLGLVAGWYYRDDVVRFARRQMGMTEPPSAVGRPAAGGIEGARRRLDSVVRARADSVVLSPDEVAGLLARALAQAVDRAPDSLEVELREGEVAVRAHLPTAPLPGAIRDLLGGVLRPSEPVELSGPVALRRAGVGEWEIRRVRVRGIPIPSGLIERLVAPYRGGIEGSTIRFEVAPAITGIRVTPRGLTLYGGGSR